MSNTSSDPVAPEASDLDFADLELQQLENRHSKVSIEQFAGKLPERPSVADLLASLPDILAGDSLQRVVDAIRSARKHGKPIIWGLGGHVIKVGLAPILTQLSRRGFVTTYALNGACAIHDLEIAVGGHTSEDVEAALRAGVFGMTKETGVDLNEMYGAGVDKGLGLGESLLEGLSGRRLPHEKYSLLAGARAHKIPVTVHMALGTDTSHFHPAADWGKLGKGARRDFEQFTRWVASLGGDPEADPPIPGGVYLNVGSAVLLPEIFLKAVTVARSLEYSLANLTTVNLDFGKPYRPLENVVKRPPRALQGQGFHLCGHHEIQIPMLAAMLLSGDDETLTTPPNS